MDAPAVLIDPPWSRPRSKAVAKPLSLSLLPFEERVPSDTPPRRVLDNPAWLAQQRLEIEEARRGGKKTFLSSLTPLRFEDRTVPWEKVASLSRHGFRDVSYDARMFAFSRPMPFGLRVDVMVEPGLERGDPRTSGPQRVTRVALHGRPLDSVSKVSASEAVLAASSLGE